MLDADSDDVDLKQGRSSWTEGIRVAAAMLPITDYVKTAWHTRPLVSERLRTNR